MRDITSMLEEIAAGRSADPLAPVTVIVPSNVAGLQLRRRLAEHSSFAAVRFETLPRLAELLAAGSLAGQGRTPLARPIGDYVAGRVALGSGQAFRRVGELPGYARVLRQAFKRLRQGGVRQAAEMQGARGAGTAEVLRLYDRFRSETSRFYDEEDLLDAAAGVVKGRSGSIAGELGSIYVVPPGAQSAGADALLEALRAGATRFVEAGASGSAATTRMILAPDPASEAREVVREVISALRSGLGVHEVAIFHGAGSGYPRLLREAFAAAAMPSVSLPGIPLSESAMGRSLLGMLNLPIEGFPRTRVMDFFALAPLRDRIPAGADRARSLPVVWDRISRGAGITRGLARWREGLGAYENDLVRRLEDDAGVDDHEWRTRGMTLDLDRARELGSVIDVLADRLEPLEVEQPAAEFIGKLRSIVGSYFRVDAEGYEDVLREVDQLGTVDAVAGRFSLRSFQEALRANLDSGILRENRPRLGDGVLVADYRRAAGLWFKQVILCGAYEGALPAGPGSSPLLDDRTWSRMRETHPFIEDTALRVERSREAAARAVASAGDGVVVWSCPVYEPGATRDFYPSPQMVRAATAIEPQVQTATALRRLRGRPWLRRSASPLATMLEGVTIDTAELTLRQSLELKQTGRPLDPSNMLVRPLEMLRARWSNVFTEWDGNLSGAAPAQWLAVRPLVGPTTLETYAKCGFRYFARSILKLSGTDEPEEKEMMEPADRGTLVHSVLERYFTEMKQARRPAPRERWNPTDRQRLATMLEEALADARKRGLTGREIFSGRESQLLRADLMRFLDIDDEFRAATGAVPDEFEADLPLREVAGVTLRGKVDRVDRTPDGQRAWIIDYKTGKSKDFKVVEGDPLVSGTKLQLPAYLAVAKDAPFAQSLYWFITHAGNFDQIAFDATPENLERFEKTVQAIVSGVAAGSFPAISGDLDEYYGGWKNCSYCEFDRICSRRRDHEYPAKSSDAAVGPWQHVAKAALGSGVADDSDP